VLQITEIRKELALALKSDSPQECLVEVQRAKAIVEGHGPGGDLRKLCKQRAPALLSLMVGARTNVVTLQVRIYQTLPFLPHRNKYYNSREQYVQGLSVSFDAPGRGGDVWIPGELPKGEFRPSGACASPPPVDVTLSFHLNTAGPHTYILQRNEAI